MNSGQTVHIPVLLDEVLQWLVPQPGQTLVDGTLGGGGHARALAERVAPDGLVLAMDRDPAAVERAQAMLVGLPVRVIWGNFCDLPEALVEQRIASVDAILLDLGISSDQLADADRGFSFHSTGPLDLRFDPTRGEPASRLVNHLGERSLADLIYQYGEERHSRRIARRIVERRATRPIASAVELAELVRSCYPPAPAHVRRERIDPATRTFQALRIAVNDELKSLEIALRRLPDCLRPAGRLAIISFHSLEDRRVKNAFREDDRLEVLTKRPVTATAEEIERNPRCRSAKLRVAARIA
jgi:16S rRNA (cytosine1402-N4)-methyltransferase